MTSYAKAPLVFLGTEYILFKKKKTTVRYSVDPLNFFKKMGQCLEISHPLQFLMQSRLTLTPYVAEDMKTKL